MNRKGVALLQAMLFMMLFLLLISSYVISTYFQAQFSENRVKRDKEYYALESDLQRAIYLVKKYNRKDLTNSSLFNQMWLGEDFNISVKEFDNWDDYVNNGATIHEVNSSSPQISWDNPVAINIYSSSYDISLEYLIKQIPDFTIYAGNNLILNANQPNYYPYGDYNFIKKFEDSSDINNDVRVENSKVYYKNSITGIQTYKFDSTSTPQKKSIEIPHYMKSQSDFFAWIDKLKNDGVVPNNHIFGNEANNNSVVIAQNLNDISGVYVIYGNLYIKDATGDDISKDIIFIVTGDIWVGTENLFNSGANFWIAGRLGLICSGEVKFRNYSRFEYIDIPFVGRVEISYMDQILGGNIFVIADKIVFYANDYYSASSGIWLWRKIYELLNGTYTISGKLFSKTDIILEGVDNAEKSGSDFSQLKQLKGTNVIDNPAVFENLPFDLGFSSANVWREK